MIESSVQRTIDYLQENIDLFLINEEVENGDADEQIKSFVELIFLYNFIIKSDNRKKLEFIKKFIIKKIREIDFKDQFEKNISALSGLAIIENFCITNKEYSFKEYLIEIVEKKKVDLFFDRVPFRVLDLKYFLNKAGIVDNLPTYQEIYNDTGLGKKLPMLNYTLDSMYSLTHTIFYLTDCGRNDYININRDEYVPLLTGLIGDRIVENDLDILGELLLCVMFLKLDNKMRDILDFAINFIIDKQKENGSFPAPIEFEYNNKYEEFRNNYHTTIVVLGVLLCYQEIKL
ncbi:MAG: hypothetical protein Q3988_06905 [Gemella sp.]|nr:hypothetical protein [Gemella sp.]